MNKNTEDVTYGLIGYPVGHSFSANFFNQKFEEENLPDYYAAISLPGIEEFPEKLKKYPLLKGLNVTSPWKEKIIPYLDNIKGDALKIRAVNTIKIVREGDKISLEGYNTDVYGFQESLRPLIPGNIKALVLGTGGASKAVVCALENLNADITVVSRRASTLPNKITYSDIDKGLIQSKNLIVNATPIGMHPMEDKSPEIPYDAILSDTVCYDLIYNPSETIFLKKCAGQGATTKNGLEMLHLQAKRSWEIWNEK